LPFPLAMDANVPKIQRAPKITKAICIPCTNESGETGRLDPLEVKVEIMIMATVMLNTCPSCLMVDKMAELVP
jgi:hypothetical protein